jgi:hypothetical protein
MIRTVKVFVIFSCIVQLCSSTDHRGGKSTLRRELEGEKSKGQSCLRDADCSGYCVLTKCWDGAENDRCLRTSQCDDNLSCRLAGQAKGQRCMPKLAKGRLCARNDECIGYCHNLRCWDGVEGDHCGKTSECQDGLTCKRTSRLAIYKTCN